MAKVVTENFRLESANEFFDSFQQSTGNCYYIMGSSIVNETTAPKDDTITNTQKSKRDFQNRVVFGNKIDSDNVRYMFDIKPWSEGVVYDAYDDTQDMSNKNFYVTVLTGDLNSANYNVFKCIRNNSGAVSTTAPTVTQSDAQFETISGDGYVWKYMFDIVASEYILFGTSKYLPWLRNASVINAAKDGVSDIIIENVDTGAFSDYLFGDVTTNSLTPTNGVINSVARDTNYDDDPVFTLEVTSTQDVKTTDNAYQGMYILIDGKPYDIINSGYDTVSAQSNKALIYIKTSADIQGDVGQSSTCQIVPKIIISPPTRSGGEQAVAYAILDYQGTIKSINFVTKGSKYDSVAASVSTPPAFDEQVKGAHVRAIASPKGGHGSNAPHELFMSRIATVSTFYSDANSEIPATNVYSKVGLIKNPTFKTFATNEVTPGVQYKVLNLGAGTSAQWNIIGGTTGQDYEIGTTFTADSPSISVAGGLVEVLPVTFDNRVKINITGTIPVTDLAAGFIVTQVIDSTQTVTGIVHEVTYGDNTTQIYLVDVDGNHNAKFKGSETVVNPPVLTVTPTLNSANPITITSANINTVVQNKYQAYSGELMHFVDFDPITRTESTKEKVKLIFDF